MVMSADFFDMRSGSVDCIDMSLQKVDLFRINRPVRSRQANEQVILMLRVGMQACFAQFGFCRIR